MQSNKVAKEKLSDIINPDMVSLMEEMIIHKQLQISSLLEVTKAINNNYSSDELFAVYENILLSQMGVGRLVVYFKHDNGWDIACSSGLSPNLTFDIENHFEKYPDPAIKIQNQEFMRQFDIKLPVMHKDEPLGLALIGEVEFDANESFGEKLKFLETITNIIIVAIENKRLFKKQLQQAKFQREMELAAEVQSLLIPDVLPKNEMLEFAAVYQPHSNVGGDYYDSIELGPKQTAFCIADITGKGIAAALLMSNFQAILRTLIHQHLSVTQLITILNRKILSITKGDKFITFFFGVYDAKTRQLKYVNAGHNPSVLLNGGKLIQLHKGTTILGMFDNLGDIEIGEVELAPDALLVNYTDGLTDLENPDNVNYEIERLEEFVSINNKMHPEEFNKKLISEANFFKEHMPYVDDISILTCRFY